MYNNNMKRTVSKEQARKLLDRAGGATHDDLVADYRDQLLKEHARSRTTHERRQQIQRELEFISLHLGQQARDPRQP